MSVEIKIKCRDEDEARIFLRAKIYRGALQDIFNATRDSSQVYTPELRKSLAHTAAVALGIK